MTEEQKQLIDKARSRRPSWQLVALSLVTVLGIIGMSAYKIGGLPGEHGSFIWLVLFVEIGAGLLVFAQAILRVYTKSRGVWLYVLSGTFRAGVGIVGFVVYTESQTITASGFWTYEIANFLMFVLEIIFSVMITASAEDWRAIARNLAEALASSNAAIMDRDRRAEVSQRKISDLQEKEAALSEALASAREEGQEKAEGLQKLLAFLRAAANGQKLSVGVPSEEELRPYASVLEALEEGQRFRKKLQKVSGILWTARKATHAWICPECFTLNEANYTQPKRCANKTCNHELNL